MSTRSITALTPQDVLDEYEGPCLFTFHNDVGDLLLAYRYTEETADAPPEFIAVPFDDAGVEDLRAGRLTIRESLSQRWVWRVRGEIGGTATVQPLRLSELDPATLPGGNSVLRSSLLPLLSLRMKGERIRPDSVPVLVIRQAVSAAEGAIRGVSDYVADTIAGAGEVLTSLRNLHVQRLGFASFEIALRTELPPTHEGDIDPIVQVKRMLSGAVRAASMRNDKIDFTGIFGNEDAGKVALQSVHDLTPPGYGPVEETEVAGRLVGGPRPHRLDRKSREYVRRFIRTNPDELVTYEGVIELLDKGRDSFVLRQIDGSVNEQRYSFDEEQYDDVNDALQGERRVQVIGTRKPGNRPPKLLAIIQLTLPNGMPIKS